MAQGLGCKVYGLGFRSLEDLHNFDAHRVPPDPEEACFRVEGLGFRVSGSGSSVQVLGFRVLGAVFRV